MSVDGEVRRFRKDLKRTKALDPAAIAKRLPAFGCRGCAKCCRGAFGDNTVTVFPGEVRAITAATGLDWLDVVGPEEEGDEDGHGNRQAFEWALRKKPDGDCVFLEGGRCTIYEQRPWICRTYPFYLDEGRVGHGECDGLGGEHGEGSTDIAKDLIARHVREIEESIALLERLDLDAGRGREGLTVVHDSEGAWLLGGSPGAYRFRGKSPR